jgi:histidine triad (HIT) family protein
MEECLFCKIINKQVDSEIVYENDHAVIFKDINPKAPVHLLAVPKKHVRSIVEIKKLEPEELTGLLFAVSDISREMDLDKEGFRVVTNTGASAGQSVDHLHFHILGNRKFNWPPG